MGLQSQKKFVNQRTQAPSGETAYNDGLPFRLEEKPRSHERKQGRHGA
jgi:hypothetical protein